jgi:hypothetical protein
LQGFASKYWKGLRAVTMPKRKRILTEFAIQVFEDGRIAYDGFDRFLWELLHGGSVKELAVRSNRRRWRGRSKNFESLR